MSTLTLPDPISAYFVADAQSAEALARCFIPQASVKDEGHTHTGRRAIQEWKAAAAALYGYKVAPFALHQEEGVQVVRAHVAGDFPGSPVDLQYRFRLERGLIASLEITA
jgi:hypothetical protein